MLETLTMLEILTKIENRLFKSQKKGFKKVTDIISYKTRDSNKDIEKTLPMLELGTLTKLETLTKPETLTKLEKNL